MTQITRYRRAWACWLALFTHGVMTPRAIATGNSFETAQVIELNHRYEGSLPVNQGRHCYRVEVPQGAKVAVRGTNNYEAVFFSAYTGRGQLLVGETQVLSSYKPEGSLETEETDGSVMVCVDSDTAQRQHDHRYSLQVAVVGGPPMAAATTAPRILPPRVVTKPIATKTVTPRTMAQLPVIATPRAVKKPVATTNRTTATRTVAQLPVIEAQYPYPKSRKLESRESTVSPYATSALQLAANSRSFDHSKDGDQSGDAGNRFHTARSVIPGQTYSGFLNARRTDDRDCYIYSNLPRGSKLKVAIANNDGILGVSAYSEAGTILIGQTYMVKQQTVLQTEETSGNVMVCMDTDGEKSDHQYTFSGQVR